LFKYLAQEQRVEAFGSREECLNTWLTSRKFYRTDRPKRGRGGRTSTFVYPYRQFLVSDRLRRIFQNNFKLISSMTLLSVHLKLLFRCLFFSLVINYSKFAIELIASIQLRLIRQNYSPASFKPKRRYFLEYNLLCRSAQTPTR